MRLCTAEDSLAPGSEHSLKERATVLLAGGLTLRFVVLDRSVLAAKAFVDVVGRGADASAVRRSVLQFHGLRFQKVCNFLIFEFK